MFVHLLSFFLYGTICFSRYISPSLKENRNEDDFTLRSSQKRFIPQGGNNNVTVSNELEAYLKHIYYDVEYTQMPVWDDISSRGNRSSVSDIDDSPPFSIIKLSDWLFPFYGHLHNEVFIDPNGFVAMIPRHCNNQGYCGWSSDKKQGYKRYVAPLMSDFDLKTHAFSNVYSTLDPEKLVIQWDKVILYKYNHDKFTQDEHGFTFQAVLSKTGDITFNYKKLPYYPGNETVDNTHSQYYPTNMGVEDAVFLEFAVGYDEKHSIETPYAPLKLDWNKIFNMYKRSDGNGVTVKLTARPTCASFISCATCGEHSDLTERSYIAGKLQCGWCPESEVCIDRFGRDAGDAQTNGCSKTSLDSHYVLYTHRSDCFPKEQGNEVSPVATILIVLIITVGLVILSFLGLRCYSKYSDTKTAKYSQNVPDEDRSPDYQTTNTPGIQQIESNQRDQHPELSA